MDNTFDPDLILAIFKLKCNNKALERQKNKNKETLDGEFVAGTSKKNWPTSESHIYNLVVLLSSTRVHAANANALKLSSDLLRVFVTEAVQRVATIAEAEGVSKIQATHLERILPQLLLDF